MEVKANVLVFYAANYAVKNEDGSRNEGVSVSYLMGGELAPKMNPDGSLGLRPSKGTLPVGSLARLPKVPAVYEGIFDVKVGGDGKTMLRLDDVRLLGEVAVEIVPDKPVK